MSAGEIFLFQTTDLHGSIHNSGNHSGASAVLSGMAEDVKQCGREKSILIDCGDLLQGSLESSMDQGKTMIRLLNTAGYDVWVPGNHDFEFGKQVLSGRIAEFRGHVLASNLSFPGIVPWKLISRNGYNIAVIGMTNPNLEKWIFHPEKLGFTVSEVNSALKKILPEVIAKKTDLIILAIHSGLYPSRRLQDNGLFQLSAQHPEIRIILGGHTHEKIVCKQLNNSGCCYFQAGELGKGYVKIRILFSDTTGMVENISGEFIPVPADKPVAGEFTVPKKYIPEQYHLPGNLSKENIAGLFAKSIQKEFPDVRIVFHGTLTKYIPEQKRINLWQLFKICPFENKVLLAYITKEEFDAICAEQNLNKKYDMVQHSFFFPDGTSPFRSGSRERVLTAFNSYTAAGAGGRFPVLKRILNRPEANSTLTDKRIFDLLKNYLQGEIK